MQRSCSTRREATLPGQTCQLQANCTANFKFVYKVWSSVIAHVLSNHFEQMRLAYSVIHIVKKVLGSAEIDSVSCSIFRCCLRMQSCKSVICLSPCWTLSLPSFLWILTVCSKCCIGLPPDVLAIIQDLHAAATTSISTNCGTTAPVLLTHLTR